MNTVSRAAAIAVLAIAATGVTAGMAAAAPTESPAPVAAPSFGNENTDVLAAVHGTEQVTPNTGGVDRNAEIDKAVETVTEAFNHASADGRMVGTVAGVVVGCPLGAVTGGTLTVLTTAGVLTPIGVVGGCILGGLTLGGLGGTIGAAITGLPALATTANEQYNALHAKGFVAAPIDTPAP
ncbi:hypothetical protein [Nocardia sp. NBC_00403]|uniref:hypothetical protein n=1 Tax=Nocardia sp. NBC_00403 TaxID=2975990 RepID=UPI002E1AF4CD